MCTRCNQTARWTALFQQQLLQQHAVRRLLIHRLQAWDLHPLWHPPVSMTSMAHLPPFVHLCVTAERWPRRVARSSACETTQTGDLLAHFPHLTASHHAPCGCGVQGGGWAGDTFKRMWNDRDRKDFVTCGAAAGVAAAFRSPVGGVLLAIEEMSSWWSNDILWHMFFTTAGW